MATEERTSKLRKLENFRRSIPFVSAAGLSAILQEVDKVGVPELHQRKHLQEARDAKVMQHQSYGPMIGDMKVHLTTGEEKSIKVINFLSLLSACYEQEGSMHQLLKETAAKFPPSSSRPWSLIFYSDEIVPGNVLSSDTSRKLQMCYVSFAEFGPVNLAREHAWFVVFATRSSLVTRIAGGMSQVTAQILRSILHSNTCFVGDSGLLLKGPLPEDRLRIFFKLGYMLQDGLAHKTIWSLKGDSGTKFCIFCSNLVSRRTSALELASDALTADAFDPSALQLATDEDLQGTFSRLALRASTHNKDDFRLWEQAVGFNYNEYALPWDPILGPHLKPCSQFVHDWMHTMFVGGVFPTLMGLTLNVLQAQFKTNVYKLIADYMKLWNLPGSIKDDMSSLFSKKRQDANKEAGIFKCTAGEGLGVYPLFAFWLASTVQPTGSCAKEINCFFALADLLDLIQGVVHIDSAADLINDAVSNLLSRCLDCNYLDRMASKFHWLVHFGFHIRKFQEAGLGQMLPSCFVQERKHKVAKRYGQSISNTTKFEYSILNEIVCHELAQLEELDQFNQACRLVKNSVAPKKLATLVRQAFGSNIQDIWTCTQVHLSPAGSCQKRDVVVLKGQTLQVAQVWVHAAFEDQVVSLVSLWDTKEYNPQLGFAQALKKDEAEFINTDSIICAVPFCKVQDELHRVLLPVHLRK